MRLHILKRHPQKAKFLGTGAGYTGYSIDERSAADMLQDAIRRCFATTVVTEPLPPQVNRTPSKEIAAKLDSLSNKGESCKNDDVHFISADDLDDGKEKGNLGNVKEKDEASPFGVSSPIETAPSVAPPAELQLTKLQLWQVLAEERRLRAESLRETVTVQRQLLDAVMIKKQPATSGQSTAATVSTSRQPVIRLSPANSQSVTPLMSVDAPASSTDTSVAGVANHYERRGQGGRGGPRCHKCGGVGHLMANCANKPQ